jgi:hypothetical protein
MHNMLRKARKTKCCQPVANAHPASATAMQFRKTNNAIPGAPAGNIENSLCTSRVYVANSGAPISEESLRDSSFEVVAIQDRRYALMN